MSAVSGSTIRRELRSFAVGLLTRNLRLKLLSLGFALLAWYYARVLSETERDFELPVVVELPALRRGVTIRSSSPREMRFIVRGPKAQVRRFWETTSKERFKVRVRLPASLLPREENAQTIRRYHVEMKDLEFPRSIPRSVSVDNVDKNLTITFDTTATVRLRVDDSKIKVLPAPGHEIASRQVEPSMIDVTGPAAQVRRMQRDNKRVQLAPLDIPGQTRRWVQRMSIPPVPGLEFSPGEVTITVEVVPQREKDPVETFPGPAFPGSADPRVPVRFLRRPDTAGKRVYLVGASRKEVSVRLNGPRSVLEMLVAGGIELVVDADALFEVVLREKENKIRWEAGQVVEAPISKRQMTVFAAGRAAPESITLEDVLPSPPVITFRKP